MPRRSLAPLAMLAAAALLTACGGGDHDSPRSSASTAGQVRATAAAVSASGPVRQQWKGAGWTAFGYFPNPNEKLTSSFYVNHGGESTTRYVDSSVGGKSTEEALRQDGTEGNPWGTLEQARDAMTKVQIDTLLLKCGSVFEEYLSANNTSGLVAGPILRIGSYGDCTESTRPVISGSTDVSGNWSSPGASKIFTRYLPKVPSALSLLFKDPATGEETPLRPARFPNHDEANGGYGLAKAANPLDDKAEANKSSFYLSDANLATFKSQNLGAEAMVGAKVLVRTTPWQLERAEVKAFDPATGLVTLTGVLAHPALADTGYYFEGKSWMMDAPGEWVHINSTLKVRMPGDIPPQGLRAAVREEGLWFYNIAKPIEVENIRLEHQGRNGINIASERTVTLRGVESVFAGNIGITVAASSSKVSGAHVIGPGNVGISITGENNELSGNIVGDVGRYVDGSVLSYKDSQGVVGIQAVAQGNDSASATSNRILNNTVYRIAGTGIKFTNGQEVEVKDNAVIAPCMRFSDCGGIYTFNTQNAAVTVPPYLMATVSGNLIVGVGPTNPDGLPGIHPNQNAGIYLDELTNRVTLENNEVVSAEAGIYLHKARFNTIRGNWVKGVTHASFKASHTNLDGKAFRNLVTNNVIENNTFFSRRVQSLPDAGEIWAVDGATTRRADGSEYYLNNRDTVYAQLWTLDGIEQPVDVLFDDEEKRNISMGNETITLTPTAKRWRQDRPENQNPARVIWQDTASVWGVKRNNVLEFKGGLNEWKVWSSSPEGEERSEIRYMPYKHGTLGPDLISNGDLTNGLAGWTSVGRGSVKHVPVGGTCYDQACLEVTPSDSTHALLSAPFKLDPTKLYMMRYDVKANAAARHRAFIKEVGSGNDMGLNVPSVSLPSSGSYRVMELLFRPKGTGSEWANFVFWGHDGTVANPSPPVYMRHVSLVEVPEFKFLPPTSELASFVVNVSHDRNVYATCEEAGLQGRCDVRNDAALGVTWPLKLPARWALTLFQPEP